MVRELPTKKEDEALSDIFLSSTFSHVDNFPLAISAPSAFCKTEKIQKEKWSTNKEKNELVSPYNENALLPIKRNQRLVVFCVDVSEAMII